MKNAMTIYRFHDAPKVLRDLSTNGGDEDWIAVIPEKLANTYIPWMEDGSSFGLFCVDEYPHPTKEGVVVRIGCHS